MKLVVVTVVATPSEIIIPILMSLEHDILYLYKRVYLYIPTMYRGYRGEWDAKWKAHVIEINYCAPYRIL